MLQATAPTTALHQDPRLAIADDRIICLLCGRAFRQLTNTHLRAHGLTPAEYKARVGYNRQRPLMCETLRRMYVERAVRVGLAQYIRRRPILINPTLRSRGGARRARLEESLNRRDAQLRRIY